MDPGNWATSLAGGSKFGYALLSVALLSNIMAIILQALCARLGVASGRDLAQACRDAFPRYVPYPLWAAGRACHLRHRPRRGDRHGDRPQSSVRHSARDRRHPHRARRVPHSVDADASAFAGSRPSSSPCSASSPSASASRSPWPIRIGAQVIRGFAPTVEIVKNPEMLYLALGILGATVMPHNLYLHSGIVQTRAYRQERAGEARGDQPRHHRFDHRADVRADHQRLDPDPRRRDLPQDRPDQCGRTRSGAFVPRAAARLGACADAVRHCAALLRPELDGDGDAGRADRHGGLSRHSAAAVAQAARHPRHRHRAGGDRHHLVWRRQGPPSS